MIEPPVGGEGDVPLPFGSPAPAEGMPSPAPAERPTGRRLVGLAEPPSPVTTSILGELSPPPMVAALDDPKRAATLQERQVEAQRRLDNLKAGDAAAVLHGEAIDPMRVVRAQAELDALAAAEALAAERAASAAAEAHRRHLGELRAAAASQAETRRRALGAAQRAFQTGIAAIKQGLDATAEIRRLGTRLGKPPSTVLDDRAQRLALSQALTRLFNGLGGDRHHFGCLSWGSATAPALAAGWGETGPEVAAIAELLNEADPDDGAATAAEAPAINQLVNEDLEL